MSEPTARSGTLPGEREEVRCTEHEAQANLLAVPQLCAAGKLRCGDKTRRGFVHEIGLWHHFCGAVTPGDLVRGAAQHVRGAAASLGVVERLAVLGTPPQRWEHAQIIAAGAMRLLRRYEEARAAG